MVSCHNCGELTANLKYCSRSCSATVNGALFPKRSPQGTCGECSGPCRSNRRYCCTECRKIALAKRPRSATDINEYMRKYMLGWYHRQRAQVVAALGGSCVRCGSTDQLELDHKDPSLKELEYGKRFSAARPKWDSEVAKAQLLCKPCHQEKTAVENGRGQIRVAHGAERMYTTYKCRCELCVEAHDAYLQKRRKAHGGNRPARVERKCGSYATYKRGCRCTLCRAANAKYMREYLRNKETSSTLDLVL